MMPIRLCECGQPATTKADSLVLGTQYLCAGCVAEMEEMDKFFAERDRNHKPATYSKLDPAEKWKRESPGEPKQKSGVKTGTIQTRWRGILAWMEAQGWVSKRMLVRQTKLAEWSVTAQLCKFTDRGIVVWEKRGKEKWYRVVS